MDFGTVTLTTYARDNSNTLLGYDVRLTLPGKETNPLSELSTATYVPGDPLREDHAKGILKDHPNLVDQALGDDRRNLLQKIIDWLF